MMKTLETIEVSVAVHGGEGEENPAGVSDDEMTIFDFGSILVIIILFCHATIIMTVARESILIFIDEHKQ